MTCLVVINSSSGEYDWIIPFFKNNKAFRCILVLNEISEEAKKKIRLDLINFKNINLYEPVYIVRILFGFIEKLNRRVSVNFRLIHMFYGLFYKSEYLSGSKFLLKDESFRQSVLISYLEATLPKASRVIYPHSFGMQIPFNGIVDDSNKSDVVLSNTDACKRFKSKKNIITGIPHQESINLFSVHSKNIIFFTRDSYDGYGTTNDKCFKLYSEALDFMHRNHYEVYIKHHPRNRKINKVHLSIEKRFQNIRYIHETQDIFSKQYCACFTFFSAASLTLTRSHVPVFDVTPYNLDLVKSSTFHYQTQQGDYVTPLIDRGVQLPINSFDDVTDLNFLTKLSSEQFQRYLKLYPMKYDQQLKKLLC